MDPKEERKVIAVRSGRAALGPDWLARERPLAIAVDGCLVATLMATPTHLEELALGYAFNRGLLDSKGMVKSLALSPDGLRAELELGPPSESCGKPKNRGCTRRYSPERLALLVEEFSTASELFYQTGAVHGAALAKAEIVVFREDVSRHNALDKLAGNLVLSEQDPAGFSLLTSGRVSAEVVAKVFRMGIGMLISRAAPTTLAVDLAEQQGMTLVGFAREQRFTVYCNPERLGI